MPPSKKFKKSHSSLPKPDELEELRDIESLFHSSLFKLQVDELFEELNVETIPDEWIDKFQDFLKNISETSQFSIDEFPLESVKLPIFKKKNVKAVLKFSPPEKIHTVGSFVLKTLCSSTPYVLDMAVEIPKVCWQKMDFLNERYHRKRALYLAYVAQSLQEAEFVEDVKFSYQNDCHLKPVLVIVPKGITDRVISLTAYPNENAFKLTRFIPCRNNVRSSWLLGKAEGEDKVEVPTAYYNATILADLLLPKLNAYLKDNLTHENVRKGLILVKLWLIQRGLMSGYGRFTGFIISMFVVYLLKKQKINSFMNPYQVFRCTLLAFQHESFEEGISLAEDSVDKPALEEFKMFPGIFLDESGFLNLLYSVNKETLDMLKHEAKLGLNILDNEMTNCFSILFMKKITPLEKYEYLIHLNGAKRFRKYSENVNDTLDSLNFGENKIGAVVPKICNILRKGLNERILLIDVVKNSPNPWSVYESPPSPNCGQVTIGLLLNPEVPLNNIEKGPLADDPQAKEFRKFWGDQSEMRRFQDGSIREAVYWPANTFEDRRRVFCQMVKDIFKRHLNSKNELVINGSDVDVVLHLPENSLPPEIQQYGTGEEAHVALMDSFNSLSKLLRKLDELPLQISSIQGISPSFHYSEVFPPLPIHYSANDPAYINTSSILKMKKNAHQVPPFTPALNIVIEFEGSGKWPDDLEAMKRVKAAFLIKIAEVVKSKYSLIAVPFLTHTDIVKDGFVFRIIIASHKELHLMKTHLLPNGTSKLQDTDESHQLELLIKIKPRLNSLLHGIQQQHFTYGTACRLAKRWVSAQLKHDYIHSTAVELLVAHIYIHPDPYTCPSSPQTAFIRFLSLIVNHDWKSSPIIVNLNNELQRNEIEEIYSTFTAERSTLPPMVIATPFDKRGALWTKNKPLNLILKRIIILARASLDTIQNMLFSMKDFDIKCVFRPPLEAFDVIIHLNHHAVPKLKYAIDVHEMNELPNLKRCEHKHKVYPIVEFDPPRKYYEELKANFEDFAFFFYDVYGGDFIGVVWKKSAFAAKDFKTSHVNCHFRNEDSLSGNMDSILEDFNILGTGLVKCITITKSKNAV